MDSESDGYAQAEGHLAKLDQMNWTQTDADADDEANTRALTLLCRSTVSELDQLAPSTPTSTLAETFADEQGS